MNSTDSRHVRIASAGTLFLALCVSALVWFQVISPDAARPIVEALGGYEKLTPIERFFLFSPLVYWTLPLLAVAGMAKEWFLRGRTTCLAWNVIHGGVAVALYHACLSAFFGPVMRLQQALQGPGPGP